MFYIDNIKMPDENVMDLFKIERILLEMAVFEGKYEDAAGLLDAIRNVQGLFIDGEFIHIPIEQVDRAENSSKVNYG